jgi:hypothetical protein
MSPAWDSSQVNGDVEVAGQTIINYKTLAIKSTGGIKEAT